MLPYIVTVVRIILRRLHTEIKFRQDLFRDACLVGCAQIIGMLGDHQLHQLCLDPFRTDPLKARGEDMFRMLFAVKRADIAAQSAYLREEKLKKLAYIQELYDGICRRPVLSSALPLLHVLCCG